MKPVLLFDIFNQSYSDCNTKDSSNFISWSDFEESLLLTENDKQSRGKARNPNLSKKWATNLFSWGLLLFPLMLSLLIFANYVLFSKILDYNVWGVLLFILLKSAGIMVSINLITNSAVVGKDIF